MQAEDKCVVINIIKAVMTIVIVAFFFNLCVQEFQLTMAFTIHSLIIRGKCN